MSNKWDWKGSPWKTEAEYRNWLRGGIRRIWSRHPVKSLVKNKNRKKKRNEKKRLVWHYQCNNCKGWFPDKINKKSQIHIDHKINMPKFELDNLNQYVLSLLYVAPDDLQILCLRCHGIKTYAERYGVSIAEAKRRKHEIEVKKRGRK